jgi:aspartate racemase
MDETVRRIVGVLGGMGPLATIDFLAKVAALTPATVDQEHVPLLVHQIPQIPDRSSAILSGSDAPFLPMLEGLNRLAVAGAAFAVIPCNTAHHWYSRLESGQPLKILHIAEAVWLEVHRREITQGRLAVMATRGTLKSDVYGARLRNRANVGVFIDEPTQCLVDRAIALVKSGDKATAAFSAEEATRRMLDSGADVVVLACTELPVALSNSEYMSACIDSTLALARYCVSESLGSVY